MRVVEMAGLAPAPFGCMLLADLGADVIRIDRATRSEDGAVPAPQEGTDVLGRGRRSVAVDLKDPIGVELVLALIERADVLVEGFRPGVMERLGLGPDDCRARNGRLVYARMTGWGQDGPLAQAAGHDINYIALSGALHGIGPAGGRPIPPANLLGDFAGGGMLLALGVLAAVVERHSSGEGQVVDAAMVDGAALLTTFLHGIKHVGAWRDERGVNLLDGGAPHYDTYETADGKHVSIGPVEPKFYAELLELMGADLDLTEQNDPRAWPHTRDELAARFMTRTRDEWCALLEGTDACFAPVLSLTDAPEHPHNIARGVFIDLDGVRQPMPAPRFDRTPAPVPSPPPLGGGGTAALHEWGVPHSIIAAATAAGCVVHMTTASPSSP